LSRRFDCSDPADRTAGIAEAVAAVQRGELVVLPTDTVYGIGADAFMPAAVQALLDAKGRGRDVPSPVLVGSRRAAQALVEDMGTYGLDLIDEFWPGALTLVCRANPNLVWDLGDTKGTVAVRMPLHELALEVLKATGPMAVSSANTHGQNAARTADEAEEMLGESVAVYLDGGPSGSAEPSSIVDLTGPIPRLLRAGAISEEKIRNVVGVLLTDEPGVIPADGAADAVETANAREADLQAREAEIEARRAELEAREAELSRREAELAAKPADPEPAKPADPEPAAKPADPEAATKAAEPEASRPSGSEEA
jgi:tRNA threonylcarbamoyl adenosine modification protein (Sua5/YciO/YrdC/YwlC family)